MKIETESQQIALALVQGGLEEVFLAIQTKIAELKALSDPNEDAIAIAKIRLDTVAKIVGLLVEPIRETYEKGIPLTPGDTHRQQEKLISAILQGL